MSRFGNIHSPVAYSCTALVGTNKVGDLKRLDDGYYVVVLGALNYFNSAGAYYPYSQSAKALLDASSTFQRRVQSGALRGEYGHPRPAPNQSMRDFMVRCNDIHEQSVSHHIRRVWLDDKLVKGPDGRPCLAIMGEIMPANTPFGLALQKSLDNPSENVCFSIRSFTNDRYEGGVLQKHLANIVTWDLVNEPGINVATKWKSPALESMCEQEISIQHIKAAMDNAASNGVSLESDVMVVMQQTLTSLESFALPVARDSALVRPLSAQW